MTASAGSEHDPILRCAKCGKTKPREEFNYNPNLRRKAHSWCKACIKASRPQYARIRYPDTTKVCPRCGVEKLAAEFYNCWTSSDGLQRCCKTCMDAHTRARKQARAAALQTVSAP